MSLAAAPPHRGILNRWTRHWPGIALAVLVIAFLSASVYTTYRTGNYLAVLWHIARCDWRPPGKNFAMEACSYALPNFYRNGLLLLDIDPRVTRAAREADVLLTGNSTAFTTFTTKTFDNQIELFFRKKGLKIFIVATEGSGFRFRKLIFDRLQLRPRIMILNIDDLLYDALQDWNRELVFNPDQFIIPFHLARLAVDFQFTVCSAGDATAEDRIPGLRRVLSWLSSGGLRALQRFYCHGQTRPLWKNLDNGAGPVWWDKKPTRHMQLTEAPVSDRGNFDLYWRRAVTVLASPTVRDSCLILHIVPSLHRSYDALRAVAAKMGRPFVFPELTPEKNWWMYDGSHMYDDSAERWTAEFLELLEPHIDRCLAK
jgi:hypothetical protein